MDCANTVCLCLSVCLFICFMFPVPLLYFAILHRLLSTTSEYKVPGTKEFFDKNASLGRPMSPHLTIYKPQLTTLLSITHRGTGVAYSADSTNLNEWVCLLTALPMAHGCL
eukprot:sb/3477183/